MIFRMTEPNKPRYWLDVSLDNVRKLLEMQIGTKANDEGIPPVTCDTYSIPVQPYKVTVHKVKELNAND